VIKESSEKEMRKLIERLVLCALIAVMRKSGPKSLIKVAERLGVRSPTARSSKLGSLIESLIASSVVFCVGLLIIARILSWLCGSIESLFDKSADNGLWPSSLGNVGDELFTISSPIIVCLFVAVFISLSGPRHRSIDDGASVQPPSLADDFIDFMRKSAPILLLCIVISEVINIGQMFYEYGSFHLPPEARSLSRLTLPVIQSFIAVAVCIFTTWYLVSTAHGGDHRGVSFAGTAIIIAVVTGFIALLYDQTFMEQYLAVHPEYGPGGDHILFSVLANVLVSVSAFCSVGVFFKTRSKFSDAQSRAPEPPRVALGGRT
jgi:hypothetical protein